MKLNWGQFDLALYNGDFDDRPDVLSFYDRIVIRGVATQGHGIRPSGIVIDIPRNIPVPEGLEQFLGTTRKPRPRKKKISSPLYLPKQLRNDLTGLQKRLGLPKSDLELAVKGTRALQKQVEPHVMPSEDKSLHTTYAALCMAVRILEEGLYKDRRVVINGFHADQGADVLSRQVVHVLPHVKVAKQIKRYIGRDGYLIRRGRGNGSVDRLSALYLAVLGPVIGGASIVPEGVAETLSTSFDYAERLIDLQKVQRFDSGDLHWDMTRISILNPAYERAVKMLGMSDEYRQATRSQPDQV